MNKNLKLRLTGIGKLLTKEKMMLIAGGSGSGDGKVCPPMNPSSDCYTGGRNGQCIWFQSNACAWQDEGRCVIGFDSRCVY